MFNFNNNQNGNFSYGERTVKSLNTFDVNDFETLQNARRDLVGELDAIIQYDDHLHKTDDEQARATWENIRDEEMVHVGELLGLLDYLAPYQKQFVEQGLKEFGERLNKDRR